MKWDEIADAYLELSEDRERILLPTLVKIVRDSEAKRVADVGGGDGRMLESLCNELGSAWFSAIALTDPTPRMREKADARLANIRPVAVTESPRDLDQSCWDVVLFVAVWMGLETEDECVAVLRDVSSLLVPSGRLVAAVTHPCFRDHTFHSYSTNFDMSTYLQSGRKFRVNLYDSKRSMAIIDTHWTLSDLVRQLVRAGLVIEDLVELPDIEADAEGAPWLVVTAAKRGGL